MTTPGQEPQPPPFPQPPPAPGGSGQPGCPRQPGGRGVPQPAPPRRTVLVLGVGALALALLCLAALLAYTLGSGPSRANSPEGVVDRYLTAFKDDDLASLRKSSCRGDAPLLDRMDRPTSLSGGTWHLTSWDVVSTEVTDDRGYVRVTIRGAGEDGGQKAETTIFPALREEGTWMVCFSMS